MASKEEEQQPSQGEDSAGNVADQRDGGASVDPTGTTQPDDDGANKSDEDHKKTKGTGSKQEQVRMNQHLSSRYSAVLRVKSSL